MSCISLVRRMQIWFIKAFEAYFRYLYALSCPSLTVSNSTPDGNASLRGLRRSLLKKSSLSSGRQICRNVKSEPKSYGHEYITRKIDTRSLTLGELIWTTHWLINFRRFIKERLTIGVPLRIQRRSALRAQTDWAIFVFELRILCPSSRMIRCGLW